MRVRVQGDAYVGMAQPLRHLQLREGGPCSVSVEVSFGSEDVTLSVADNGRGFELRETSQLAQLGKLGLLGMKERAQLLGAEFTIQSRPGQGTSVRVRLPIKG